MANLENKCAACSDPFEWDDTAVIVGDDVYHNHCIDLYPTGFVAYIDGEWIGETENDDGQMAYDVIDGLLED